MGHTLPGKSKLTPLKLINRITKKSQANEKGSFVFTSFFEGARSKRIYRITLQEIKVFGANAYGGSEILKDANYEEKIKSIALNITASTLFELRISGYFGLAKEIRKEQKLMDSFV